MANIRVTGSYRTYRWIKKNPVIDKVRTILQDDGVFKNLTAVHEMSGVSTSTLHNWFHGDTKNPQHGTVMAVITALGYVEEFVRAPGVEIDVEAERESGRKWLAARAESDKTNGKTPGRKKAKAKP